MRYIPPQISDQRIFDLRLSPRILYINDNLIHLTDNVSQQKVKPNRKSIDRHSSVRLAFRAQVLHHRALDACRNDNRIRNPICNRQHSIACEVVYLDPLINLRVGHVVRLFALIRVPFLASPREHTRHAATRLSN